MTHRWILDRTVAMPWLLSLVVLGGVYQGARAQAVPPSQVTPPSVRPIEPPARPGLELPPPTQPPSIDVNATSQVSVGRVNIAGAFPGLQAENTAAIHALEHNRVTVAEIFAVAALLEKGYAHAGYILARVVVPPQHLIDDGPVQLTVVDGFIETVDVSAVPARAQRIVSRRLATLIDRKHVTLAQIERAVLLAGDTPGLTLRSTLTRGEQEGGAKLVLQAAARWVSGSIAGDNRLPASLGRGSASVSLALNDAFGLGEQLYGSETAAAPRSIDGERHFPLSSGGIGLVLPLMMNGWSANAEYTSTITHPLPQAGVPITVGYFDRLSLRSSYPLLRSLSDTLLITASYDKLKQRSEAATFDTDINRDDFSVVRLAADASSVSASGRTLAESLVMSRGVSGRSQADAASSGIPLSRQDAEPIFTKLNGDAHMHQPLFAWLDLSVVARGQLSFRKPLLTPESFSLDGTEAISGFAAGTLVVDQGVTLRAELSRSFSIGTAAVMGGVSPYVFGAGGRGTTFQVTAVQIADAHASSFGAGCRARLRASRLPFDVAIGAEYARGFSNQTGLKDVNRVNVTASVIF